jgi:Bacteriophage replication gene A protein (GPA)
MIETGEQWARRMVGELPPRWESRLYGRWNNQRQRHAGDCISAVHAERDANIELRETVQSLATVRISLDASDSTICQAADTLASRAADFSTVYHHANELHLALERMAWGQGIEPPKVKEDEPIEPAIKRMQDAQWWRRKLRAHHAKIVEGAAIGLGYVNKKADPYVSRESVIRRTQQNERNAASLEATTATNEEGQEFTLAELAAKGPANKAIRRAELMTRIAGFERIADDLGHIGLFFTMTAPSRMHKWRVAKNGTVQENPKYDGTLPNDAQKHLAKTWARIRAALARRGLMQYGFRIAEPNHDGTPHWHILVFLAPHMEGKTNRSALPRFCALVRRYALGTGTDRTEAGAKAHRCDFKPIDKGRGSAAGYIAKYVAKNIDGYRLDKDLIGNDAIETSHRVEAWASTWRIRQFQQIGGPPVGPWRELRRVKQLPSNAPAHLIAAHTAANRQDVPEGTTDKQEIYEAGAKWDRYVKAQGGPRCGRRYAIRVEKTQPEGKNKYGEPMAPIPMGVSTLERYQPAHMTPQAMGGRGLWAERRLIVESARYVWQITKKVGQAIGRVANGLKAQLLAPWTCVNNCTGEKNDGSGTSAGYHPKIGFGSGASLSASARALQIDDQDLHRPPYGGSFGYQCGA